MKILSTIILFNLLLLSSCANNGKDVPNTNVTKNTMSQSQAKNLAQKHLALKNITWGEPVEVSEADSKYFISYDTPLNERRILGIRTVVVDQATSVVSIRKRR